MRNTFIRIKMQSEGVGVDHNKIKSRQRMREQNSDVQKKKKVVNIINNCV